MRKKWNCDGFTIIEMLCTVALLTLLSLMLGAGVQAAARVHREITARTETRLLLNTLVDAIADELRYASGVETDGGGNVVYNDGITLAIGDGRVLAGGKELLPKDRDGEGGAYHGGKYQAEGLEVRYEPETGCFTFRLKVVWKEGGINAETPEEGIVIRCLNPPEKESEGGTA